MPFLKIVRGHVRTVIGNVHCMPNLKSVALTVLELLAFNIHHRKHTRRETNLMKTLSLPFTPFTW